MSNNLPADSINFEELLQKAVSVPRVYINREKFLRKELSRFCDDPVIGEAVSKNPAQAGISTKIIDHIAKSCITFESTKVTAISAAAGIPGGFAMIGTIPADMVQYFAHMLRIMQKLAYLYGWPEFMNGEAGEDDIDDGLANQLTLFVGVMFGVKAANTAVEQLAKLVAVNIPKQLMKKALTKGAVYPLVKKIARYLGIKMTKEIFAKSVGKIIPIVGAVVSGGITAAGFIPMSNRVKKFFSNLPLADPKHYKDNKNNNGSAEIEVDFEDIDTSDPEI